MNGRAARDDTSPDQDDDDAAFDAASLTRDWITLWQSELSALATDREVQETWHLMLAFWSASSGAMLRAASQFGAERADGQHRSQRSAAVTPGHAGATAATGASPVAAASDAGLDAVERLHGRIAELEQRLAELERGRNDAASRRTTRRGSRKRS